MKIIFIHSIIALFILVPPSMAQDLPGVPPSFLEPSESNDNSIADLLKTDLLKRLVNAQKEKDQSPTGRVRRPKPELGKGQFDYEPVDLSKYIGTEGDPQKAYEKLQDIGKVPGPVAAPFPSAATKDEDLWKDVPPEKRLAFVNDLLERRKFKEGLSEIENFLDVDLKPKMKMEALMLREKLLFHEKYYEQVENDYFRLKSFYPNEKSVDDLKSYLEKEAGLQPLQEASKQNPVDPKAQRQLLDQYLRYDWLDLAEEFFAETIQDTSKPTIESLSEIYYRKHDFPMLTKLNEAAQTVHPHEAVFPYNQAVGIWNDQNPGAKTEALELFKKARTLARTPAMQQRIDWYLNKLNR
jgi:hypothetical protein